MAARMRAVAATARACQVRCVWLGGTGAARGRCKCARCQHPRGCCLPAHFVAHLLARWSADVDLTGGTGDEFEVEAIEESSSEDDEPLAARAAARRPPSASRRPAVAAAATAAGGGARAAALGRIDAFLQVLPRGTPSAAALAGGSGQSRQQAGALASRAATAEEQQLDLLDYANLMVGIVCGYQGVFKPASSAGSGGLGWAGPRRGLCSLWQVPLTRLPAAAARPARRRPQAFGNPGFRPQQRAIVEETLAGRNCFVLMPTGGAQCRCCCWPLAAGCCAAGAAPGGRSPAVQAGAEDRCLGASCCPAASCACSAGGA